MPLEPHMDVLPYGRRKLMFWTFTILFFLLLPIIVLYTSGYRLVTTDDGQSYISPTGAFYVAVEQPSVELYVNDKEAIDHRPFSSAFYVQGYDGGIYEVRTQSDGVATWVKNLPIYPQIVTEVQAFNLPNTPQVRIITPWIDTTNTAMLLPRGTSTPVLPVSTTSNTLVFATSSATTSLVTNQEYEQLELLFASSTEVQTEISTADEFRRLAAERFIFGSTLAPVATHSEATSTKIWNDALLFRRGEDVIVRWVGSIDRAPNYYCLPYVSKATTSMIYGAHVYESLRVTHASGSDPIAAELENTTLCRTDIQLDRKNQEVIWFEFLPGTVDLVLLQLTEGLYITEVDDRAWQNVQLLYPGTDILPLVEDGRIFVKDGRFMFEVFTELQ